MYMYVHVHVHSNMKYMIHVHVLREFSESNGLLQLSGSGTTSFSDCIFNTWDHDKKVHVHVCSYIHVVVAALQGHCNYYVGSSVL